jgi:hypothetical protein
MVIFLIEHIVRINEKIDDILSAYHISLSELKENNLHITDFNKLLCGTKLHIPYLSQETEQILESTEGFVMSYYAKMDEISDDILEDIKDVDEKNNQKPINIGIGSKEIEDNISSFRSVKNAYPGITPPRKPYMGNRNR